MRADLLMVLFIGHTADLSLAIVALPTPLFLDNAIWVSARRFLYALRLGDETFYPAAPLPPESCNPAVPRPRVLDSCSCC